MDANLYSGLTLAYIGDCAYEMEVRKYFVFKGLTHVDDLHKTVIKYTCAERQAKVIKYLTDNNLLSEKEVSIFKRGRNSKANKTRKTLSNSDYLNATGFESLMGYLYLNGETARVQELSLLAIEKEL